MFNFHEILMEMKGKQNLNVYFRFLPLLLVFQYMPFHGTDISTSQKYTYSLFFSANHFTSAAKKDHLSAQKRYSSHWASTWKFPLILLLVNTSGRVYFSNPAHTMAQLRLDFCYILEQVGIRFCLNLISLLGQTSDVN